MPLTFFSTTSISKSFYIKDEVGKLHGITRLEVPANNVAKATVACAFEPVS